jgi:hypothetical protein
VTKHILLGRRPALAAGLVLCCLPLAAIVGCRSASSDGETATRPSGTAAGPASATGPAAAQGGPVAVPMRNNMHRRPTRPN